MSSDNYTCDYAGTLDSLCGSNHDPSLRTFAEKCYLAGREHAAINAKAREALESVRQYFGILDDLRVWDCGDIRFAQKARLHATLCKYEVIALLNGVSVEDALRHDHQRRQQELTESLIQNPPPIGSLLTLVNRLPKTADGKAVLMGDTIFHPNGSHLVIHGLVSHPDGKPLVKWQSQYYDAGEFYSTAEAAVKAGADHA